MSTVVDKFIRYLSPKMALHRELSRQALLQLDQHAKRNSFGGYEAAQGGRRTSGWNRSASDANTGVGVSLRILRGHARELCRNNGYAAKAKNIIANNTIGWGIYPRFYGPVSKRTMATIRAMYREWADGNGCDFNENKNFSAIQKLIMRTTVEAGECLVIRKIEKNNPFNFSLQTLEGDYIDGTKDGYPVKNSGKRIVLGIQLDERGKRESIWLYGEHPGSNLISSTGRYGLSEQHNFKDICHIFEEDRPGQLRGITWYSPAIVTMKDLDEYKDATLMRQKIAACFAVAVTDNTNNPVLGNQKDIDMPETLEPGMILRLRPGKTVESMNPPTMTDHDSLNKNYLQDIAAGTRCTVEDLTGDYKNMPFSAAKLSRISHWGYVRNHQYEMMIPSCLTKISEWLNFALMFKGVITKPISIAWTPPPMPIVEPEKEALGYARNIRTGLMTYSEALTEMGRDPEEFFEEYKKDIEILDKLGIVLDSDARQRTQSGNAIGTEESGSAVKNDAFSE